MNSPGVAPQFGEAAPLPPAAPTPAAFVLVRASGFCCGHRAFQSLGTDTLVTRA